MAWLNFGIWQLRCKVYPLHTIIAYGAQFFERRLRSSLIANHFKVVNNLSWIKPSAVATTELESVYQKVMGLSQFSPLYAVGDFPLIIYDTAGQGCVWFFRLHCLCKI